MKLKTKIIILVSFLLTTIFYSCEKEVIPPVVVTGFSNNVTSNSALLNGQILSDGGGKIKERGFLIGTSKNLTLSDKAATSPGGVGQFSVEVTGLERATLYYYAAYATNSAGTIIGLPAPLLTDAEAPTVTTLQVTDITPNSALAIGKVIDDGGGFIVRIGFCVAKTNNPTTSNLVFEGDMSSEIEGQFEADLKSLEQETKYYIRAFADNGKVISYGTEQSFTTKGIKVTTFSFSFESYNSISAIGKVTDYVDPSNLSNVGFCFSKNPNPTINNQIIQSELDNSGVFTAEILGLELNTKYYLKAFAKNDNIIAYGEEVSFTTATDAINDINGNSYSVVPIGKQFWLGENLRVSKYKNGDGIFNVLDNPTWSTANSGAYSYLGNNVLYDQKYGKLYNFYAVIDSRGLCPTGWHVPTTAEWDELITFLGGISKAGQKLKSREEWISQTNIGTNISGFNSLPSGYRTSEGAFGGLGELANIWSSSSFNSTNGSHIILNANSDEVTNYNNLKTSGFSVRCLKD